MRQILFILLILLSLPGYGATYYVSNLGTDAAGEDGSMEEPWATLSYACTRAVAYDLIIIMTDITDNNRAVLSARVNVTGIGNPTITTAFVASSGADAYITMNASAGNAVLGNNTISYINFDGNLTATRCINVDYKSNVVIHHCDFVDFRYSAIIFRGTGSFSTTPTNTLPTGNKVWNCNFVNCTQLTGNAGNTGHIRLQGQNGFELYNCSFDQTGRTMGENTDMLTGYQNRGMKIHDCTFIKPDSNEPDFNFFAEFHYSNGGFELYNNDFTGGAAWDVSGNEDLYGYGFGMKIYGNTFRCLAPPIVNGGHRSAFLDLETFTVNNDIYIYNNYFKYARIGILYCNTYIETDNVWIYNNIFEDVGNVTDNGSYGIKIDTDWGGSSAREFTNIHILNNVIDAGASAFAGITIHATGNITNMEIKNNIINGNFNYAFNFSVDEGASPVFDNVDITHNMTYGAIYSNYFNAGNITYTNSDLVTGNLWNTNPLFVSATNFHLQSNSPATSAGTYVGLSRDYDNRLWGNPPSIGAYESLSPPIELTTNIITSITTTTATTGGTITSDGGFSITQRGVAYGTSSSPTIAGDHTINGVGTGSYTSLLRFLTAGTRYYVRAYAVNSAGIVYGNERSFTTATDEDPGVAISGPLLKKGNILLRRNSKLLKK